MIKTEERMKINLMYPHKLTEPILEEHGCTIEAEVLQAPLPFARLVPGDTTYYVIFPPGTKREEQLPASPHARRYRLILPDGSVFDENYYLDFHQSIISEPPPPLNRVRR